MVDFGSLEAQMRDCRWHLPATAPDGASKPIVVLLHGLGGDAKDWVSPFQERNWPYDHRRDPEELDLGEHRTPPVAKLPGVETFHFLSPRLTSNSRGVGSSDDRSWWHALIRAGFPVVTYSQVGDLMIPFGRGPIAEFKVFMEGLQRALEGDAAYRSRPVVILGHSRGGLIGRAFLGDPDVKADRAGRFPRVDGLITLSSPHQGSHMALVDDKLIRFLSTIQKAVPTLPNDVGNRVIEVLKTKIDDYVGPHGDEIEPQSLLFRSLARQEPIRPRVRCISVGGTSPRLLRVYLWTFTADSLVPKKAAGAKLTFRWRAKPLEAKGASPIPDGLPLKLLGLDLDEVMPGRGDGLTADKRCRFPSPFAAEEHLTFRLSHAEELWDPQLQEAIVARLGTF
jgi:pimeloyl-ACP methyl ester carboxylesterase